MRQPIPPGERLAVTLRFLATAESFSSLQYQFTISKKGKVAHQAGAYPGLQSIEQLGILLLPSGWDASPLQGYPQH